MVPREYNHDKNVLPSASHGLQILPSKSDPTLQARLASKRVLA